jgi:hypothetical protein
MKTYHFLEYSAFIVIAILGLKLTVSVYEHYYPNDWFSNLLSSHATDIFISVLTVAIFFVPIITSNLMNFPKKKD